MNSPPRDQSPARQPEGANLAKPAKSRSLLPKEHGAYGQLGLPLLAALLAAPPAPGGVAFAVAAAALFLIHEPLVILLGQRGERARKEDGPRARRRLIGLLLLHGGSGAVGLSLADWPARCSCALPGLLGLVVLGLLLRRLEKTAPGEIVAAAALAAAALPVAISDGVPLRPALAAWLGFSLGFAAVTLVVRGIIAAHKGGTATPLAVAVGLPALIAVGLAVALRRRELAAAAPLLCAAAYLHLRPPPTSRLRLVGFAIVGAGLVAVGLVAASAWAA